MDHSSVADLESAAENPEYFLAAFGLRNPLVVWAIGSGGGPLSARERAFGGRARLGVLDDLDPIGKRGRRVYRSRATNQRDVPIWNRRTLRALPRRPRLGRRRVL